MPLLLGGIVMWSGTVEDIPIGWALCNGTNGTLDLRNRFIVGAGGLYNVGATGGSADSVVVTHQHSITINTGGHHGHSFRERSGNNAGNNPTQFAGWPFAEQTPTSSANGSHSHTVSLNNTGVSATNANLPPYYALAFIQQIV
jgi:hypothetical protein